MAVTFRHNIHGAVARIDGMPQKLEDELNNLVLDVLFNLGSAAQINLRSQGAHFGERWVHNSKWIDAKKGRGHRPLHTLAPLIRPTMTSKMRGRVAFHSPGNWTLTQHHQGFTKEAHGREVEINIVDPSPLGLSRGTDKFKFLWKNDSKTPARRIWPTEQQANNIAGSLLLRWAIAVNDKLVRV